MLELSGPVLAVAVMGMCIPTLAGSARLMRTALGFVIRQVGFGDSIGSLSESKTPKPTGVDFSVDERETDTEVVGHLLDS